MENITDPNIMKVKIRDYRIIANMELQFFPGLNILQGASNAGKSSVVSAIRSCIYNIPGTTNVRHGQNDYYVGIGYNNNEVLYKKGKSGNTYIVNGQQYLKTGVNQLPAVADALKITDVILGDEKIKVNFWNQMSYPFLLDKSPGQLFKFIADSGEDEGLTSTQKSMVKDRQSTSVELTLTEGKLQAEKDRIKLMESDIKSAEEELKACEAIIALDCEINNLNNLININNKNNKLNNDKQSKQQKLNNLNKINMEQVNEYEKEIEEYKIKKELLNKYNQLSSKKLSKQSQLSVLPDILDIDYSDDLNQLSNLKSILNRFNTLTAQQTTTSEKLSACGLDLVSLSTQLKEFKVCPLCGSTLESCLD